MSEDRICKTECGGLRASLRRVYRRGFRFLCKKSDEREDAMDENDSLRKGGREFGKWMIEKYADAF
jgi:hypothetical protein